jgi:hypothetical protein
MSQLPPLQGTQFSLPPGVARLQTASSHAHHAYRAFHLLHPTITLCRCAPPAIIKTNSNRSIVESVQSEAIADDMYLSRAPQGKHAIGCRVVDVTKLLVGVALPVAHELCQPVILVHKCLFCQRRARRCFVIHGRETGLSATFSVLFRARMCSANLTR